MNEYLLRRYDTYFNEIRNETVIECVDDETAINAAKSLLHLSVHPLDTIEIQICSKDMAIGEWCMFAAVFYDSNGNDLYHIGIEDCCFC